MPYHLLFSDYSFIEQLIAGLEQHYKNLWEGTPSVQIILPTNRLIPAVQQAILVHLAQQTSFLPHFFTLPQWIEDSAAIMSTEANNGNKENSTTINTPLSRLGERLHAAHFLRTHYPSPLSATGALSLANQLIHLWDQLPSDLSTLKDWLHTNASHHALSLLDDSKESDPLRSEQNILRLAIEDWPIALKNDTGAEPFAYQRRQHIQNLISYYRALKTNHLAKPIIIAGLIPDDPLIYELFDTLSSFNNAHILLPPCDPALITSTDIINETHPIALITRHISLKNRQEAARNPWGQRLSLNAASPPLLCEVMNVLFAKDMNNHGFEHLAIPEKSELHKSLNDPTILCIECTDHHHEASVTCALISQVLDHHPNASIAVLSDDRRFKRMLTDRLTAHNIDVDDSEGIGLDETAPMTAIIQLLRWSANPNEPNLLFSWLQHPLLPCGLTAGLSAHYSHQLEYWLRTHPPANYHITTIRESLLSLHNDSDAASADHSPYQHEGFRQWFNPLHDELERYLYHINQYQVHIKDAAWFDALLELIEILAKLPTADDCGLTSTLESSHTDNFTHISMDSYSKHPVTEQKPQSPHALWSHYTGQAVHDFMIELKPLLRSYWPAIEPHELADWIRLTASPTRLRLPTTSKRSIALLPIAEGRFMPFHTVIMPNWHEGIWPPIANILPFIPLPLIQHEKSINPFSNQSLRAYDAYWQLQQPQRALLRCKRDGDGPTSPSRWWIYLMGLRHYANLPLMRSDEKAYATYALNPLASSRQNPCTHSYQPSSLAHSRAPSPPLTARPTYFSPSRIELLLNNPYDFYCQIILQLPELYPLAWRRDAAHFGLLLHRCLDQYTKYDQSHFFSQSLPNRYLSYQQITKQVISNTPLDPAIRALWTPRLQRIAYHMAHYHSDLYQSHSTETSYMSEYKTKSILKHPSLHYAYHLHGRIDHLIEDPQHPALLQKERSIRDFKTTKAPKIIGFKSKKPQLPILAWILQQQDPTDEHCQWHYYYVQFARTYRIPQLNQVTPKNGHNLEYIKKIEQDIIMLLHYYEDESHGYAIEPPELPFHS
jgi:inactivated superfamily I helicase/RecB family exonuclease